jgi:hypothetical protein
VVASGITPAFQMDEEDENEFYGDYYDFINRVNMARGWIRAPKKYIRDASNPIEDMDDFNFKKRYRFTKETIMHVLRLFLDDLIKPYNRGLPVPVVIQLLTALRFYATSNMQVRLRPSTWLLSCQSCSVQRL